MKIDPIRAGSRPAGEARIGARIDSRRAAVALSALAALSCACLAEAQSLRVVPTIAVGETYSDNAALAPDELARSGWISDLMPGLRIDLNGARAKGFLNYRLHEVYYSTDSALNYRQHDLNSLVKLEAVENWLFVDAKADITQQNRSAFGAAVTPGQPTASNNRVETTSLQVAPYIRGRLSDAATYHVRYVGTNVRADSVLLPTTRAGEWVAKVGSASTSARVGWAVDANRLEVRNDVVGSLYDARVRGSLIFAVNPQFHVSAIEGMEATDFAGPPRQSNDTPGFGLQWSPSERTQLAAVYERRFFGTGHAAAFSHRTPLTAWKLISVKDAAVLPTQLATGNAESIQKLMFDLLASAIPDPKAREEAVKKRLEETGLSESSALSGFYITSSPFVYRTDGASFALLGANNTVTLTLSRQEQRGFGVNLGEGGVPPLNQDVRRSGANANWARKLSPVTTITLAATTLRTEDLNGAIQDTRQKTYNLFLAIKLGPKTAATLGVRRDEFDSGTPITSYRENAIYGSLAIKL